MLETLVSSKVRRALLEYILRHPQDRFYLRGLAKDLSLSVSPLRRELKRLEHAGMLQAIQEGNILFYQVHMNSPAFLQLKGASLPAPTPMAVEEPRPLVSGPIHVGTISPDRKWWLWQGPLSRPALMGVAGIGMALLLIVAGVTYLVLTNQRVIAQATRAITTQQAEVTIVAPAASTSGTMRGARWQVVPGGFGGFSSGATDETY